MRIPIYQIDAFTGRVFSGNPAAVCPLEMWLDDATLQAIATENNLSETAFFVSDERPLRIRWFTPTIEVDLCGHATLAAASVYFEHLAKKQNEVTFESQSGRLTVSRRQDLLVMDFPSWPPEAYGVPPALAKALGVTPREVLRSRDYMAVLDSQEQVQGIAPDMAALATLDADVIITAPGDHADFVSRYFAPNAGIPEDPVTGSTHCTLIPYWAKRLGKTTLTAQQVSVRGGELFCEDRVDRVEIAGRVARYMEGFITIG